MPQEPAKDVSDVERITAELKQRVEKERAAGGYADDLSGIELEVPAPMPAASTPITQGFDLEAAGPRVRFRPELGFSAKPIIGPPITLVKKVILRLLFYVLDDLAQQTDTAVKRVETALAVEVTTRERMDGQITELKSRIARLEAAQRPPPASGERQ